ncbi:MAG TPA: hypothetical protein VKR06_08695 [Ktedonosporobacter sp.]|nr:hypothetical protein [Ktedonosporobacter sp.]
MSNEVKKTSTFSRSDAAPNGRPRGSSRPKPVTEARAAAQREKVERQRAARLERSEPKERQPTSLTRSSKKGSQGTTINWALDAYIQDQVGVNRSKKTIEWHRTALGLFATFLDSQEQIRLITEIDALHITNWFAHLRTSIGGHGKVRSERTIQTYAVRCELSVIGLSVDD